MEKKKPESSTLRSRIPSDGSMYKGKRMQKKKIPSKQSEIRAGTINQTIVKPIEPVRTFPPIAGFWRRFFASSIDVLILGVIGQIIGLAFSSYLFNIGLYGRLIGLLFLMPYFGIMNSKICSGQTFGKQLMGIAVRNKNNEPIEIWRSIIRISLLVLPFLLNNLAIPILKNSIAAWIVSFLNFGLGGAFVYTMVFNRNARQGIHDMLLGTYVVRMSGKPLGPFPVTPRTHWIVVGIWVGIAAIGTLAMTNFSPTVMSQTTVSSEKNYFNILQEDPRFFTVNVKERTTFTLNETTSHSLIITVWYKGMIAQDEAVDVANSIAKTVLENETNLSNYDSMQINVTSAIDIGIATRDFGFWYENSIEDWLKIINPNGSLNGYNPSLLVSMMDSFPPHARLLALLSPSVCSPTMLFA